MKYIFKWQYFEFCEGKMRSTDEIDIPSDAININSLVVMGGINIIWLEPVNTSNL